MAKHNVYSIMNSLALFRDNMDAGRFAWIYIYIQQVCGKKVKSPGALSSHMRSHDIRKNFYGCFLCDESFASSNCVLEHVKTHAVNGIYQCPKVSYLHSGLYRMKSSIVSICYYY